MRYPLAAAVTAFLGLSCFVEPIAHTQGPNQDPQKPPFVLEAGTYGLKEFLLKCASHLEWNLLLAESDFQGPNSIDIQKAIKVDTKGCLELMTNLAFVKDFAIVPVDTSKNIYQAIFIRGPRRPMINITARFMSPLEVKQLARTVLPVVTTVRLKHVSAPKATATVRPFFASTGAAAGSVSIGTAGNEEMVLLQGFANQVAQAIRLFEEIDQPPRQTPSKSVVAQLAEVQRQLAGLEKRLARLEKAATKEGK